jgi:hypothetical protein
VGPVLAAGLPQEVLHPLKRLSLWNPIAHGAVLSVTPVFVKYQSTSVEQTEEAKPVNPGPQIAKAHGVTSPQRDFV